MRPRLNEPFDLVGVDGNAFSVMGYVANCMRVVGKSQDDVKAYQKDAMSSDYSHLLAISVGMVDECEELRQQLVEDEK